MTHEANSLPTGAALSEGPLASPDTAMPLQTSALAARPYRIIGLLVSFIPLAIFTFLYCLAGLLAAYMVLVGPARVAALWTQALSDLRSHTSLLPGMISNDLSPYNAAPYLVSILLYIASILAVLTVARWRGGGFWRQIIAWRPWTISKAGRAYWITGAVTLVYSLIANGLLAHFYPASKQWFVIPKNDPATAAVLFILAVVFAPIAEELLFRGWIYTSLRAQFGFIAALLVSALTFALAHNEETHLYALVVFPIGLGLGVMREKSQSVQATIIFHAIFNTIAFVLAALDLA